MQYRGLSSYALCSPHFPVENFIKVYDTVRFPAIVFLWNTFGQNTGNVVKVMKALANKKKFLEIHFSDEAARRNNTMESGEFMRGMSAGEIRHALHAKSMRVMAAIDTRAIHMLEFCKSIDDGNTEFCFSDGLEDDYDDEACANFNNRLKKTCPYEIVRSRDGGSDHRCGANFTEQHTTHGRNHDGGIVNEDALEDPSDGESRKFIDENSGCKAVFLWRKAQQVGSGPRYPRAQRKLSLTPEDAAKYGNWLSH